MATSPVCWIIEDGFYVVSSSDSPFRCPQCVIAKQSEQISSLKASIAALSRDVAALKERLEHSVSDANKSLVARLLLTQMNELVVLHQ